MRRLAMMASDVARTPTQGLPKCLTQHMTHARLTMMASDLARMSSKLLTPSWFSTLEMILMYCPRGPSTWKKEPGESLFLLLMFHY